MTNAIPICLCIDVEPDLRCIHPTHRLAWTGFEALSTGPLAGYRALLTEASGTPARFCWSLRLDPQIEHTYGQPDWGVERYRNILDALRDQGDEIGLHTHAWRWDAEGGAWIGDYGNAAWVDHCLRSSFQTYQACFGRAPRVFSFGDRFMSNRVMEVLEEFGVLCDFTIEPGRKPVQRLAPAELTTGWIPDYRAVPRTPYRPAVKNYKRRGRWRKRGIWELPVSTGRIERKAPECEAMLLGSPFPGMQRILEQNLSRRRPYILAIGRTDVTLDTFNREQLELFLRHLATHPLRRRFVFVPPIEALCLLHSAS